MSTKITSKIKQPKPRNLWFMGIVMYGGIYRI